MVKTFRFSTIFGQRAFYLVKCAYTEFVCLLPLGICVSFRHFITPSRTDEHFKMSTNNVCVLCIAPHPDFVSIIFFQLLKLENESHDEIKSQPLLYLWIWSLFCVVATFYLPLGVSASIRQRYKNKCIKSNEFACSNDSRDWNCDGRQLEGYFTAKQPKMPLAQNSAYIFMRCYLSCTHQKWTNKLSKFAFQLNV